MSSKMDLIVFKKVIVSNRGEITQDIRNVGDSVRFRIYYASRTKISATAVIIDKLDAALTDVKVFHNGHYDLETHTITWEVSPTSIPPLKRRSYVEFEAVIEKGNSISNQALIEGLKRKIKSNTVEIKVIEPPEVGWIPFIKDAEPGEPPRIYMKDETTMGTTLRIDIPGMFVYEEKINGETFHHLSIHGRAPLTDLGKPELPLTGEIVEVPFGVDFKPEIVKSEITSLSGYNIYPAQPPKAESHTKDPFILDSPTYIANADYPASPIISQDEDLGVIRGHRLFLFKTTPFQYNPKTRQLKAYSTLEIRLNYNRPAQLEAADARLRSTAFEKLIEASILNYKDPQRFKNYESEGVEGESGCDYLIITHDAFYNENDPKNPIVRLLEWKNRKGYRTKVKKVGTIPNGGNSPSAIKSYIKNAYDTWNPPPTYILLVGDADLVSAYPGSKHPNDPQQPPIQTDLYYVTADGNDYFPDIYIGRLSADNTQQLTDIVDKILNYEQNPPNNAAFYDNISLVSVFTDDGSGTGQEDFGWISDVETIRNFLINQNYTVERIYTADSGYPVVPGAQQPLLFNDGVTPLPNDLINSQWSGITNDITNALNNGRFLITYRGHGFWSYWDEPRFSNTDIAALNQNGLTPVIISITCQTGWFDNETDNYTKDGRGANDDSYTEMFLRQQNSGSVAILGMTRDSYSGYNDFLVFGIHKAMWPVFTPNPPWSGYPTTPTGNQVRLLRMGQILNFGKMYMARAYSATTTRKVEFEMGHLFGDPEMIIWTNEPGQMNVEHPEGVGETGVHEFMVNVHDANNKQGLLEASVVLTRDKSIIAMEQTSTDGLARFQLVDVGSGDLDITVTANGFRPYMGKIMVKSGSAVINRLEPQDGTENQDIHVGGQGFTPGEQVDLYLGSQIKNTTTADSNGEFGQGSAIIDIKVPAGYVHGPVTVKAHGKTSDRYALRIFHVRSANPVDLWTYDQYNKNTWSGSGDHPNWNSPDIQLYDENNNMVASDGLEFGKKYKLKVNIHNNSFFMAKQAKIVFEWANFGAGGPWEEIDTVFQDVPAGPQGTAVAETSYEPQTTGHLCVRAIIEHVEDVKPENNVGQENLHVGYSSSPLETCFIVWNLTDEPAPVHFEVRQLKRIDATKERLWASWVKHPDPQIIAPGERSKACVTVDPDWADVPPGTKATFAVTTFIGGKMIGGVNLEITKGKE
jgi:hypothetical protein